MNDLKIIYEDADILALAKPAGVNFDWALEDRPELFVVHRLDKDTSGIILFAKNEKAQEYLRGLFKNREIKKSYLALVVGNIKEREGKIELAIGRSKKTPLKRVAIGERRGTIREAATEYVVLKRLDGFTLVEAFPKTGRTHQIRSHFAAIGHPVACDKLYSGRKTFLCPAGLARQFLHAFSLELTLPSGTRIRLEAELPRDLKNVLENVTKERL
ncbi:hypothetical protein A2757_01000 [Candidatus Giovannonibacteria bacterium RIFCSPHIGHO2_01_FULL_48_47]|nr:MAG: hypothetical protein A2757_01000 [Candidatus Giovannonibacteria bacterium RIFCSPHIGHO2_01_FULL_48_47]OGF67777.1 MAG: hypothetical protein A3D61_02860 [Candidatus Giovannonibacteria bacterium RIFCSPHIGHO2_02_FULL_48_15]OGF88423.1 MAG: hypothetical protein A3B26_01730 [Candidatus Giovannonibacteria bacterium RIFCSPLOWO2_01_FULL_48_47]OGF94710.1 MAG: hypothetical protein A2433_03610 [Candidatus Giovannonibacteria bacterium RIFOXYC1_FULL_48_8]OGF96260.1 MAG: hypothetical protein A2613_01680